MAWTTPRTWLAGEIPTATTLNTHIRDNFKAIGDAWTAYTPTWTAATTNPTLGNGVAAGWYIQAGKLVIYTATITMGSTTTYGTGQYSISLPAAAAAGRTHLSHDCEALIGGSAYPVFARIAASATTARLYCEATTAGNPLRSLTASAPAAWASGSVLTVSGTYEAA